MKGPLFPNRTQCPPPPGYTKVLVEMPILTSIQDYYDEPVNLPMFSPDELLGMMVLCPMMTT